MNAAIKAAVGLTAVIVVLSLVWIFTGLHAQPMLGGIAWILLATAFTAGAIFWGLKQTAAENGYGRQLLNGIVVGIVAAALIFAWSALLYSMIFPGALEEAKAASLDAVRLSGAPQEFVDMQVKAIEQTTAVSTATQGAIGTVVVSILCSLIVAIFQRKK